MRISSLRIENLRAIKEVTIPFDPYSCLIGANGSGKSTILHALNIFFRELSDIPTDTTRLQEEDFHQKKTSDPIRITITFVNLSMQAQEDFADYYRHGELTVSAIAKYDENNKTAEVKQYGLRRGIDDFRRYFEAKKRGEKVPALKLIYEEIRNNYLDLPKPSTQPKMTAALHEYEAQYSKKCTLIESAEEFYDSAKGGGRLGKHIQWIFVPAVKDVLAEQMEGRNTALGKILERTVRAKVQFSDEIATLKQELIKRYGAILDSKNEALNILSIELQEKLRQWAHPNTSLRLEWKKDPEKSVQIQAPFAEIIPGEGNFEGNMARFGHGLQRSYLFAILHILSSCDEADGPTLILGCEEPELFQHPPQLRHLANVFRQLSKQNSQIILCTHSPHFVSGDSFEDVRLVRKDFKKGSTTVSNITMDQLASAISGAYPNRKLEKPKGTLIKIHQALQPELNEMFFAQTIILVEGHEDLAYLTSYMHLIDMWDEFRRLGCHFVPAGGKSSIVRPLITAIALKIPCFVVFDADGHVTNENHRKQHEADNLALLTLLGLKKPNPFPNQNRWGKNFIVWKSEIGREVKEDIGSVKYDRILSNARNNYSNPGEIEKSYLLIADALDAALRDGLHCNLLKKSCENILKFAKGK